MTSRKKERVKRPKCSGRFSAVYVSGEWPIEREEGGFSKEWSVGIAIMSDRAGEGGSSAGASIKKGKARNEGQPGSSIEFNGRG